LLWATCSVTDITDYRAAEVIEKVTEL
jgi:hypothetical protein